MVYCYLLGCNLVGLRLLWKRLGLINWLSFIDNWFWDISYWVFFVGIVCFVESIF